MSKPLIAIGTVARNRETTHIPVVWECPCKFGENLFTQDFWTEQ